MTPLSRATSAAASEANRRLLRILEMELGKIADPAKRGNPSIDFWNRVADQCHEERVMRHFNGFGLKNQKWPQLCRLVAQRFEKGKNLSAKDKWIIQIRQLQDPTFCTRPRDEVIVLPCSAVLDAAPELSDNNNNDNILEIQDFQPNDNYQEQKLDVNSQVPLQQDYVSPPLPPFIFPPFLDHNSSLYDDALRAFTRMCDLISEKTTLEIQQLRQR